MGRDTLVGSHKVQIFITANVHHCSNVLTLKNSLFFTVTAAWGRFSALTCV